MRYRISILTFAYLISDLLLNKLFYLQVDKYYKTVQTMFFRFKNQNKEAMLLPKNV